VVELEPRGRSGLLLELSRTGIRSQEHELFTTGFTNAGRTVGSPLGPDAWSAFLRARGVFDGAFVEPWVEYAHLSSNTYRFFESGPVGIELQHRGEPERRLRGGAAVRI